MTDEHVKFEYIKALVEKYIESHDPKPDMV